MPVIDLHSHSTASDGELSPADLVSLAAKRGVQLLALTDHDTCDGLELARQQAVQHGLCLINGVELSASWQAKTYHVVGLRIDPQAQGLNDLMASTQQLRQQRAQAIAERLARKGIHDTWQQAQQLASGGLVTRSHFAKILLQRGLVSNIQQAFDRYLGQGKAAYVPMAWPELEAVIAVIHQAGGQAVLAHPIRYPLTASWRRRLLEAFKAMQGDAIEVCYGNNDPKAFAAAVDYARRYQFQASVGSDFHAPGPWIQLGALRPLPADLCPVWADWPELQSLS